MPLTAFDGARLVYLQEQEVHQRGRLVAPYQLSWPLKAPDDTLPHVLDFAEYLAQSGLVLLDVSVSATPGLAVHSRTLLAGGQAPGVLTAVLLEIGGGVPDTTELVALRLLFTNGDQRSVTVQIPIGAALPGGLVAFNPTIPANALRVAGVVITVAGNPILV